PASCLATTWCATPASVTLSLHDALPIYDLQLVSGVRPLQATVRGSVVLTSPALYIQDPTSGIRVDSAHSDFLKIGDEIEATGTVDRKSTRLNSSHEWISYAVFCLNKKNR